MITGGLIKGQMPHLLHWFIQYKIENPRPSDVRYLDYFIDFLFTFDYRNLNG